MRTGMVKTTLLDCIGRRLEGNIINFSGEDFTQIPWKWEHEN